MRLNTQNLMVLTIDIGNTKTKIAVFKGKQLVEHVVIEQINKNYEL